MGWTKRQQTVIKYYYAHRDHPPTLSEFFPKLAVTVLIFAFLALSVFMLIGTEMPTVTWFFIGMLFGAALRLTRQVTISLQDWPVVAEVTDWDKVFQLAAAERESAS